MIDTVKKTETGFIVNGSLHVPTAPDNRHYQMIQEWIKQGNSPEPKDPEPKEDSVELMIHKEIRAMAVDSLRKKGKLD